MSAYTISRTYKGTSATALPGSVIGKKAHMTFTHAVSCFGYLLEQNETISLEDWRWRIAKHCAPSDRIIAILNVIDRARGEPC